MTETRAIKVESCGQCGLWCLRGDKYYCLKTNKELPNCPDAPPETCSLPKWPSLSHGRLRDKAVQVIEDHNLGEMHITHILEELMREINVEVSDGD